MTGPALRAVPDRTEQIVEWLTECLNRLKATADNAGEGPWVLQSSDLDPMGGIHVHDAVSDDVATCSDHGDGVHIVAHDPQAVRARIAAEREIIAAWRAAAWRPTEQRTSLADAMGAIEAALGTAIEYLAHGHRHDHHAYREHWTPDEVTP